MSGTSKIEWTDATWNPVTGCTKVSQGCKHCYAERLAPKVFAGQTVEFDTTPPRHPEMKASGFRPRVFTDIRCHPERLDAPLHWKKPRRIFVNSMSDLFHEDVPDEFIDKVFAVMAIAKWHTFQVLTKRADRMRAYMTSPETPVRVDALKHVIMAGRLPELTAPERVEPIAGWPGYFITSKGRVLSDRRPRSGEIRPDERHELKLHYGEQGHARAMLQVEGRIERLSVHRLVLSHFDRPASDGEQGRHLDGNPKNNALWNLAWGDQPENWSDSKRHGTRRRYSKLNAEQVEQIRARLTTGESAYVIAPDFGVSDTQIQNIAKGRQWQPEHRPEWPLRSVWLGVSVEDQATADERIPLLLQTPAAVRFLSCEPLLGPVLLRRHIDVTRGGILEGQLFVDHLSGLDWVITGGESGPRARPSHPDWFRSLRDQCATVGVPYFFKQWGEWWAPGYKPDGTREEHLWPLENGKGPISYRVGKKAAGRRLDGRTHDEYPVA